MAQDDLYKIANEISDILGEKLHGPRKLVKNVIQHCGKDFAQELLRDTEEVMAAGGMLTAAGDRLRTKGGIFFYLARGRMSEDARQTIFPPHTSRGRSSSPASTFNWADRLKLLPPLIDQAGEVESVKITLIGRPGKTEIRDDLVITAMSHSSGSPTFPRGVPQPPAEPTLYTVYIGLKQWKQVSKAMDDPEDMLIVEGTCAYDPALNAVAVYCTKLTTKLLETQKRQDKSGSTPTAKNAAKPDPAVQTAPDNTSRKLQELHAAADLYRQKIATIESKPEDQQFGLEMTQKLLRDVEDKINSLEKQRA